MEKNRKNIILFGAAGSGKGTQGDFIIEAFNCARISPGSLFRKIVQSNSDSEPFYDRVAKDLSSGKLLDIEIVNEIMNRAITLANEDKNSSGIIFDGYPRNEHQDSFLRSGIFGDLKIDLAIYFVTDEKFLLERLSNRIVCEQCGATFNKITKKTKIEGVCDECGNSNLLSRTDDVKIEAIHQRFNIFKQETLPVIESYKQDGVLVTVDGTKSIEDVWEETRSHLEILFNHND